MNSDPTPINARPKRPPEPVEDLALALREHMIWPVEDWILGLGDAGRAAVAGGAVALALAIGIGGYSLAASGGGTGQDARPVAAVAPAPKRAPATAATKTAPKPTLQGAAPVFKAPAEHETAKVGSSAAIGTSPSAATPSNSGDAATDTISSTPAARPAEASASTSRVAVDGPPAGPAAIAVARKFAGAFVVYETGGEKSAVRKAFVATASPQVVRELLRRPPRQPAGVEVPKAKVLNVIAAPSHDGIYPVSVSLLRVGATSELRLELEKPKNEQWRVVNVLG